MGIAQFEGDADNSIYVIGSDAADGAFDLDIM
jgi:hypothetical protein